MAEAHRWMLINYARDLWPLETPGKTM